jgi:hypothetical protein
MNLYKKRLRRKRRNRALMVQPFHSKKMNANFVSRSSWERAYFKYLDENPEVIAYYVEYAKVPYVSNKGTGKVRNYIPDLIIEYADRKEMVEIKPVKQLNKLVNIKKFDAARTWCATLGMTFRIVTEIELKKLNLIK